MLIKMLTGLLALVLLQAHLAHATEAIRSSASEARQRAELNLNGNMECILENDRMSCVPASR